MSKFGSNLKSLRSKNNVTQTELAEVIGVSKSAVSMYENSQREPSFEIMEAIADFFNVPLAALVSADSDSDSIDSADSIGRIKIRTIAAHAINELNDEQIKKVIEYAEFVKSQEKK
jgi:transcriptional regulator with XRE-family HTH domain